MAIAPTARVALLQAVCTPVGLLPAFLMQWSLQEDEGVAIGAAPVAALGMFAMTALGGVAAQRWIRAEVWRQVGIGSAVGAIAFMAAMAVAAAGLSGQAWVLVYALPSMLGGGLLGWGGGVTGASVALHREGP